MNDIQLKVNELCDLIGVSPQAIRLYEKVDAVPLRKEENGYRFYFFDNIGPAIAIRSCRKLGISLKESAQMCNGSCIDEVNATLLSHQKELENLLHRQQAILQYYKDALKIIQPTVESCFQFTPIKRPAMYHLLCEENGEILKQPQLRKLIRSWSEQFPFVKFCPVDLKTEISSGIVAKIGFCVLEKDKEWVNVDHPQVRYLPEVDCIGGVIRVVRNTPDYYSVIQPGLTFLKEHQFELSDDIYTILIASGIKTIENGESVIADYHMAYYPIKK